MFRTMYRLFGIILYFFVGASVANPYRGLNLEINKLYSSYEDSFARNTMLPLSAAAYSTSPQKCLTNVLNATLKRQVTVKCDAFKGDTCSGYSAVALTQKAIIISFRGTEGFLQLVEEGVESIFQAKVKFIAGGNVNLYFYDAFMDVWNGGLKDDLLFLKNQYPGFELWVTGHSLGGAMASLAASYIATTGLYPVKQIKLVTFGQPRTGDAAWAKAHDDMFAFTFRLTHSHDLVAHVPLEVMDYQHHAVEVFYKKEDMGPGAHYAVCATDESKLCSDGNLLDLSMDDHDSYFDHNVSDYGDAGCVGNV